jgi:hypothetical protein
MTTLDSAQMGILVIAILLQIYATILVRPLRKLTIRRLWFALMGLNYCVLARRFLSLAEVGFGWRTENYHSITTLIGLAVSCFMLLAVFRLRVHLLREKELAEETVRLAEQTKSENSAAYRLALYFIQNKNGLQGEKGDKGATGPVGPRGFSGK